MMLVLDGVHKQYSKAYRPALRGIDIQIEEGEFCILVGANGSGKSTLMKIISGEIEADSGSRVLINQHDATVNRAYHRWVASVSQNVEAGTVAGMTFLENLVLSGLHAKSARLRFYSRHTNGIESAVERLGLKEYLDRPLACLSGGQRQMMAVVMAIFAQPKIILLDEHTSSLDPEMQVQVMDYTVDSIRQLNLTAIMVTHNLADAIHYGDRLVMLERGRVVLDVKGFAKKSMTAQELFTMFHGDRLK